MGRYFYAEIPPTSGLVKAAIGRDYYKALTPYAVICETSTLPSTKVEYKRAVDELVLDGKCAYSKYKDRHSRPPSLSSLSFIWVPRMFPRL